VKDLRHCMTTKWQRFTSMVSRKLRESRGFASFAKFAAWTECQCTCGSDN
jgi:hypothetical protein